MRALNPKSQIPNPKQIPNSNFQDAKTVFWRKVFIISIATICIISLQFSTAEAKTKKKKKETTAPKIEAAKKEERLKQAAEKLNNTQWQIKLTQISLTSKKESLKDTLHFINNKMESQRLISADFLATSYTLSLKGENLIIWETMQTGPNNDLAFWKGEIEGEIMRGVLSLQPQKGEVKDYSFVSISKEIITKEKAQEIEQQSQGVPEEKPTELKKEEKKKKWFW